MREECLPWNGSMFHHAGECVCVSTALFSCLLCQCPILRDILLGVGRIDVALHGPNGNVLACQNLVGDYPGITFDKHTFYCRTTAPTEQEMTPKLTAGPLGLIVLCCVIQSSTLTMCKVSAG